MNWNGKCECGCKIAIADANGRINSFKPNYRQIYVMHENGITRINKVVCQECLEKGEYPGYILKKGFQGKRFGESK